MKAIQFTQPGAIELIDAPEPPPPGPGDVVVRVRRVGVCGTDYAGYLGKMAFFSYPRIPGHELGVEVLAVGAGVTNVKVGDRCCVEPYINCQQCYACRRGHTNCCMHNQTLGVHCDGGLQPLFALPARKLHPSPNLSDEQNALVETLAIGCHAVNRATAGPNDQVLVLGAGPIGLSVIEFARLAGARVLVGDISEQRLRFAREQMGVAETILLTDQSQFTAALEERTGGQWCDVVVDATGSPQSMSTALEYCAFAGRLVFVGITQQELKFPHAPIMHRRELSLLASRNALPGDFTRIIDLIEAGQIDTRPWITHHAPMHDLPRALPTWLQPEQRVVKAIVEVS
jgi:alcohol dehydrogenase